MIDEDVLEYALSMLLDELRGEDLTSDDIRRETIDFIVGNIDVPREEVEAMYDGLYPDSPMLGQKVWR